MDIRTLFLSHRDTLASSGFAPPWILVFDIDSTIMDTFPRNRAILDAAVCETPAFRGSSTAEPFPGGIEVWDACGAFASSSNLDPDTALALRSFWQERFFANEWLSFDRPYPGVRECLHALKDDGFVLVYLTGRDAPNMEAGTRRSFVDSGLPAGKEEIFVFKPDFSIPDAVFKNGACRSLSDLGCVVGTVDNIADNSNLFERNFPRARHVCFSTISPAGAEALSPTVLRAVITDWCRA